MVVMMMIWVLPFVSETYSAPAWLVTIQNHIINTEICATFEVFTAVKIHVEVFWVAV
jgi:hypothetical protein